VRRASGASTFWLPDRRGRATSVGRNRARDPERLRAGCPLPVVLPRTGSTGRSRRRRQAVVGAYVVTRTTTATSGRFRALQRVKDTLAFRVGRPTATPSSSACRCLRHDTRRARRTRRSSGAAARRSTSGCRLRHGDAAPPRLRAGRDLPRPDRGRLDRFRGRRRSPPRGPMQRPFRARPRSVRGRRCGSGSDFRPTRRAGDPGGRIDLTRGEVASPRGTTRVVRAEAPIRLERALAPSASNRRNSM
jgi:hypothetical protein